MDSIVLFEHETWPWGTQDAPLEDWVKEFHETCTRHQIRSEEQEAFSLVVRNGRLCLKAHSLVGVFTYRGRTIEVLPKISRTTDGEDRRVSEEARREATRLLLHMLEVGGRFKVSWMKKVEALLEQRADFVEILRFLYADTLRNALLTGVVSEYVEREEETSKIRGLIAFEGLFPWNQHRPPCRYQDFVTDTPLNRILYHCCQALLPDAVLHETRNLLRACIGYFLEFVEHVRTIPEGWLRAVRFTRLNDRFQPAFELARLFLRYRSIQPSSGCVPIRAFFLDMNRVFEDFVVASLEQAAGDQGKVLRQGSGLNTFALKRIYPDRKPEVLRLRPDAVIEGGGRDRRRVELVVDAKWKITDFSREDAGIERDDFYQAIAYGLAYRAPVVLVFPGLREDLATAEFVVEHGDAGIEITAVQVPVTTPCRTSRELRQQTAEHLYSVLQRHSSGLSSSVLIGGVHEQLD